MIVVWLIDRVLEWLNVWVVECSVRACSVRTWVIVAWLFAFVVAGCSNLCGPGGRTCSAWKFAVECFLLLHASSVVFHLPPRSSEIVILYSSSVGSELNYWIRNRIVASYVYAWMIGVWMLECLVSDSLNHWCLKACLLDYLGQGVNCGEPTANTEQTGRDWE